MNKPENNDKNIAMAWQKMAGEKFNQSTIKTNDIMSAIKQESKSSISELIRRLKYKLYWCVFFTVIFTGVALLNLHNAELVLLSGIVAAAYALGLLAMYFNYKRIRKVDAGDANLLQSARKNVKLIKSVLRTENVWGSVMMAPIIFIAILAGRVISGHPVEESLNDPSILITGLVAIVVLTPILIWLSGKMNNYAYGHLVKKLEENIVKMETLS
ncbi:MAG: hypothetical protein ACLFPE_15115 [Bacteroidales bacterium]